MLEKDFALVRTLEELSLNALPCLQQILDDGWVLRLSEGFTKRANSVTPLYPGTEDLTNKINRCEAVYDRFNQPAIFRLTDITQHLGLDRTLAEQGYVKRDSVSVRVKSIDNCDRLFDRQLNLTIKNELSEEWLDRYVHAVNLPIQDWQTISTMLDIIPNPVCYALLKDRSRFCSCGFAVLENSYLGIFFLVTAKQQRRKGYASQTISAMLDWGKNNGATTAYLQVETANQAGINLYNKLGFREIYQYFYRLKL